LSCSSRKATGGSSPTRIGAANWRPGCTAAPRRGPGRRRTGGTRYALRRHPLQPRHAARGQGRQARRALTGAGPARDPGRHCR
jgi:hypothetical protein